LGFDGKPAGEDVKADSYWSRSGHAQQVRLHLEWAAFNDEEVLVMVYVPPSGWVEVLQPGEHAARVIARFHGSLECPRIQDRDNARKVDKPYSAVRCTLCASEVADEGEDEVARWESTSVLA
jgi:hypothetical protein